MRTISANTRAAFDAEDTDEVVAFLMTIVHPDLDETLRLSSDSADLLDFEAQDRGTRSRGQSYIFVPMDVRTPEEGDDASGEIQVVLYDVGQAVTPLLRSTTRPAYITIELVLASAPDHVEVSYPNFELTTATVEAGNVTLTLTVDTMASEPFPADSFTPGRFGGLWTEY